LVEGGGKQEEKTGHRASLERFGIPTEPSTQTCKGGGNNAREDLGLGGEKKGLHSGWENVTISQKGKKTEKDAGKYAYTTQKETGKTTRLVSWVRRGKGGLEKILDMLYQIGWGTKKLVP